MLARFGSVVAIATLLWMGGEGVVQSAMISSPSIIGGSPALWGASHDDDTGGYSSFWIFDNDLATKYASNMQGVNTFLDFDFGAPTTIAGLSHVNNGAYDGITSSQLIFSDDPSFSTATSTLNLSHLTSADNACNEFRFDPVTAQYVRWQVTGIDGGSDCQGASYMRFHDGTERGRLTMTHIADSGQYSSAAYNAIHAYDGVSFNGWAMEWASNRNGVDTFMDFDFGTEQSTDGFVYQQRCNDYVASADLIFSNDPTFSTIVDTRSVTLGTGDYAKTSVSFDQVSARYVRFDVTDTNGINPGAGNMYFVAAGADTSLPDENVISCAAVRATSECATYSRYHLRDATKLSEDTSLGRIYRAPSGDTESMWLAGQADAGITGGEGSSPVVADQEIVFDLGGNFDVNSLLVWNLNGADLTENGVKDFDVYVSNDGDLDTWTLVGSRQLAEAGWYHGEPAQTVDVNASNVRMVKLDIQTMQNGELNGPVGLEKVRFEVDSLPTSDPTVLRPVAATASSTFTGKTTADLINGSGFVLPDVDRADLCHCDDRPGTGTWHAARDPDGSRPVVADQWLIFDLGDNYDLEGALVWNHNQLWLTERGVDEFDIYVSTDDDPGTFTLLGTRHLLEANGEECAEGAQLVDLIASNVRLVKFDIKTAHSGEAREYVGLSEVRFVLDDGLLEGDLNDDGFVGGDDLDIVRSFWGQTVEEGNLSQGDPSNDGFVGGDDLDIVRANWGQGTPPAPTAVPEPATFVLLMSSLLAGMALRRRRS